MDHELALPVSSQPDLGDQLDYADRAAALGYDRVWVAETWGRDAVTTLATVAARTREIGIGTSIASVYSRSPALIGQTAATLAEAADGRFRLGLGQSAPPVNQLWHGVEHERPFRRLRETIEIVRRVLAGEVVDYDGEVFSLAGFRLRFDPPDPPPRIDAAAMGPKAMELAGRFADGVHTTMMARSESAAGLEALDRGIELGDRSRDDVRVLVGVPACALEDGERARDAVRHHLAFYVGSMGTAYRDHLARQGFSDEAEAIVRSWTTGEQAEAEAAITEAMLEEFAIVGTPAEAREHLERWASQSWVDAVVPVLPVHTTVEENVATIEAMAP